MGQTKNLKHKDGFCHHVDVCSSVFCLFVLFYWSIISWLKAGPCSWLDGRVRGWKHRAVSYQGRFDFRTVGGREDMPSVFAFLSQRSEEDQFYPENPCGKGVSLQSVKTCVNEQYLCPNMFTHPTTFCFFELHVDLFYKLYMVSFQL